MTWKGKVRRLMDRAGAGMGDTTCPSCGFKPYGRPIEYILDGRASPPPCPECSSPGWLIYRLVEAVPPSDWVDPAGAPAPAPTPPKAAPAAVVPEPPAAPVFDPHNPPPALLWHGPPARGHGGRIIPDDEPVPQVSEEWEREQFFKRMDM